LTSTLKAVLNDGTTEDAGAFSQRIQVPSGRIAAASLDADGGDTTAQGSGGIQAGISEVIQLPPVALPSVNLTALAVRAKQLNLTSKVAQLGRAALARPSVQGWLSRFDLRHD
jgi:hypothetical protein